MDHFIEYVCRGVMRSEDAIKRLNKNVATLAKSHRNLSAGVICLGVAGLLLTSVIADQDKEIKALKKQVKDLTKVAECDIPNADEEKESENQEGA